MQPCERLKAAREQAGYETAADAARAFGWQTVTYRHHENGTRGFKRDAAIQYARALRVSPEWILFGRGGPEKSGVPLVGYIGAGAEVYAFDDGGALDRIEPPPGVGPDAVAVKVRGDSMWPRYSDGDMIVYDNHTPVESLHNRECIVSLPDGRKFVKTLRPSHSGLYDLESYNAPPIRDVKIEWAAEIKWVKRG